MKSRSHKFDLALRRVVFGLALLVAASSTLYTQSPKDRQLIHPEPSRKSEKRTALIIGNSAYRNASTLNNPGNDAQDIAEVLRQLGFELVEGRAQIDQNGEQMKRLIIRFGEILKNTGGVGLFYYAGHGLQVAGRNYLIPIEASNLREQSIEFDAVDVGRVLAEMDAAGNGLNLVILDACRSNPFRRSWRSTEGGLAPINAPEGTLIAYATSPGRVADDGDGRNGIYTAELLKQLRIPNLTVEGLFKAVRSAVRIRTSGQQIPWESSSLIGDFYFSSTKDLRTTSLPPSPSRRPMGSDPPRTDPKTQKTENDGIKGIVWLLRDASINNQPVFMEFLPDGSVKTSTPQNQAGWVAGNMIWYRSEDTLFILYFDSAARNTIKTECKGIIKNGRIEGTTRTVETGVTGQFLLTRVSN